MYTMWTVSYWLQFFISIKSTFTGVLPSSNDFLFYIDTFDIFLIYFNTEIFFAILLIYSFRRFKIQYIFIHQSHLKITEILLSFLFDFISNPLKEVHIYYYQ